jgi:hypothetical protein
MKTNKQITLDRLKEAYKTTHAPQIKQAYQELKQAYQNRPDEDFDKLSPAKVLEFDHVKSLLTRSEYLEAETRKAKILQSKRLGLELERHQYAPEMNTLRIYRTVNGKRQDLLQRKAPQATRIGEALERLTSTEIKNLCLYV